MQISAGVRQAGVERRLDARQQIRGENKGTGQSLSLAVVLQWMYLWHCSEQQPLNLLPRNHQQLRPAVSTTHCDTAEHAAALARVKAAGEGTN